MESAANLEREDLLEATTCVASVQSDHGPRGKLNAFLGVSIVYHVCFRIVLQ